MTSLTPFQFDNSVIRTLLTDNGEVLFVASDIAKSLGYSNTRDAIINNCRKSKSLKDIDVATSDIHINQELDQKTKLIPESDVYRLVMRSKLESAERFQDWVVEEVLPTIRKTGGYSAPNTKQKLSAETVETNKVFRSNFAIARLLFPDRNQAILSANQATLKVTGTNVLQLFDSSHLVSEDQERYYTPTELGTEFNLSAQGINKLLEEMGLQIKDISGKWVPTDKGKPFAVLLDTGKKHSNGTPIQQLKWKMGITSELKVA